MLAIGTIFFGQRVTQRQVAGACLSILGVLLVLSQGDPRRLAAVRLVPGDFYMLLATAIWAWYSWLLTGGHRDAPEIRRDWAAFLLAQVAPGVLWSLLFTMGEWTLLAPAPIQWGWPLVAALAFIVAGPSLLAYRCWDLGVRRMGPNLASLFLNLTPLFAALLSAAFLNETPSLHHGLAFALIVAGIGVSTHRR
jgi:drug/metabolite transporter (DMT)-like permease